MGFMFCYLHVSLKQPFVGGYKFVEFALFWIVHCTYLRVSDYNFKKKLYSFDSTFIVSNQRKSPLVYKGENVKLKSPNDRKMGFIL